MQIVEQNSFDVRVAISRFAHPDAALQIVLLPMIHIGSPAFYEKISDHLRMSDAIIYEGVTSRKANILFRVQRMLARFNKDGFVHQSDGIDLYPLRERLIHGDVSMATFDQEWRSMPLWVRGLLQAVLPFAAIYLAMTGTKQAMARVLAMDDLPSREEVLDDSLISSEVDRIVLDVRDTKLLDSINRCFHERRTEPSTVAILYGAAHMRAVIRFITGKLGYRAVSSEWVIVFEL